jgi:GNAT superfamily N-acetyltransferase
VRFQVRELDVKLHERAGFDCGVEPLNRYLRQLAAQHRTKGIATTFVLVDADQSARILGYYALSAAALSFEILTDADRKGLPTYPIPAVRIGRLAAATSARGQGTGELLLQNAIKRILQTRNTLVETGGLTSVHRLIGEECGWQNRRYFGRVGLRWAGPPRRSGAL